MKKMIFTTAFVIGISFGIQAQISINDVNKVSSVASKAATSSFDVGAIGSQIVNSLQSKIKLSPEQVTQTSAVVTELLNKKKNALPMLATDKAGYQKVMSGIQTAFPSKMKTILKAQQYASLLQLIPKTSSSTNILSKLLF